MAVPEISFRDGQAALESVNGHLGTDGSYTFNSSPDTNVTTFNYALQVTIPTGMTTFAAIRGSATKVVRVREISVVPVSDTASNQALEIFRGSDQGVTGSAVWTAITPARHEQAQAPTGFVYAIDTAVPTTPPTSVGISDTIYMFVADGGDASQGAPVKQVFRYGDDGSQAMVLRGTDQYLYLSNDAAATNAGTIYYITIKLTEEAES